VPVGEGAIGNADKDWREDLVLELINDLIALQRNSLAICLYEATSFLTAVSCKSKSAPKKTFLLITILAELCS
jgi:hypothetical protein